MQHSTARSARFGSTYTNIYCMFAFETNGNVLYQPRGGSGSSRAPSSTLPTSGPGLGVQGGPWFGQGKIRMEAPVCAAGRLVGARFTPRDRARLGHLCEFHSQGGARSPVFMEISYPRPWHLGLLQSSS